MAIRAEQLQDVIQDLYEISVQVYAYQGSETTEALALKMYGNRPCLRNRTPRRRRRCRRRRRR